jgi:hypothetical protein
MIAAISFILLGNYYRFLRFQYKKLILICQVIFCGNKDVL